MNVEHKTVLQLCIKLLQEQLSTEDVQSLLDHLYSEDIVTRDDTEAILGVTTCSERVSRLVLLLERRGRFAYPLLVEGLRQLPGKDALVEKFEETEVYLKDAKATLVNHLPKLFVYDCDSVMDIAQIQDDLRADLDPRWRRYITKAVIETALVALYPDSDILDTNQDKQRIARLRILQKAPKGPSTAGENLSRDELIRVTVLSTATDMLRSTLTCDDIDEIVTHLQVYEHVGPEKWNECFSKTSVTEKIVLLLDIIKKNRGQQYEDVMEIINNIHKLKHLYDYCRRAETAVTQALEEAMAFLSSHYDSNPLEDPNKVSLKDLRDEARQNCDRKLRRFVTKILTLNAANMVFGELEDYEKPAKEVGSVKGPQETRTNDCSVRTTQPYVNFPHTAQQPGHVSPRSLPTSPNSTDVKTTLPPSLVSIRSHESIEDDEIGNLPSPPPVPSCSPPPEMPAPLLPSRSPMRSPEVHIVRSAGSLPPRQRENDYLPCSSPGNGHHAPDVVLLPRAPLQPTSPPPCDDASIYSLVSLPTPSDGGDNSSRPNPKPRSTRMPRDKDQD